MGDIALVDGVFPQGERDVWQLVLSDDSTVECDDEHLWIVGTSSAWDRGQEPKVLTAREIRADIHEANGSSKWYLPAVTPVDLGEERRRLWIPISSGCFWGWILQAQPPYVDKRRGDSGGCPLRLASGLRTGGGARLAL